MMNSHIVKDSETCKDCGAPVKYCVCVYRERMKTLTNATLEAMAEAQDARKLWQAAASCILHNRKSIRSRGVDEDRMLKHAEKADLGTMWAGSTIGWIKEPLDQ